MIAALLRGLRRLPVAAALATAHPAASAPLPVAAVEVKAARAAPRAKRFVVGTALATLCCTTITGFEGMRLQAYIPVPGDVPTICIGETRGVRMGMRATKPECEAMLVRRLGADYAPAIERCVTREMGDDIYAAFLSLAYNIGTKRFCRSSVVHLWNADDRRGACDALLLYDRAGGRVLAGLVRRRRAERELCLKGV